MNIAIFDIDGTLADFSHRLHHLQNVGPYDYEDNESWRKFTHPDELIKDIPFENAQKCLSKLANMGWNIIFITGRNEKLSEVTSKWIFNHFGIEAKLDENLFMRPFSDSSDNATVKSKLVEKAQKRWRLSKMDIVFDDDPQVFGMYESFGFLVLKAPDCWKVMFPIS